MLAKLWLIEKRLKTAIKLYIIIVATWYPVFLDTKFLPEVLHKFIVLFSVGFLLKAIVSIIDRLLIFIFPLTTSHLPTKNLRRKVRADVLVDSRMTNVFTIYLLLFNSIFWHIPPLKQTIYFSDLIIPIPIYIAGKDICHVYLVLVFLYFICILFQFPYRVRYGLIYGSKTPFKTPYFNFTFWLTTVVTILFLVFFGACLYWACITLFVLDVLP